MFYSWYVGWNSWETYLKLQLWFYSNFQSHAATHTKPFNMEILKQKQNNIDEANSTDFFAPIWARYVILLLDDRQQAASFWQVAVIKLQQQCNIEAVCHNEKIIRGFKIFFDHWWVFCSCCVYDNLFYVGVPSTGPAALFVFVLLRWRLFDSFLLLGSLWF